MTTEPRYIRNPGVLWRRASGRLLLLEPSQSECLILSGTALSVWDCFEVARSVEEATGVLAASFGATPTEICSDVAAFTDTLVERGALIESAAPPNP